MRIAALYDIHGNLPALEAVFDDIGRVGADEIVVGGDVTLGPMPRATLERLEAADIPVRFIEGNCDRIVLALMSGGDSATIPEQVRESARWVAQRMSGRERTLAAWSKTLRVTVPSLGDVLFCHATPRSDEEIFSEQTPEEELLPIFGGLDVALVVCGHTHAQFDRTVGHVRVVNAGSVGMPFGHTGADWLLLGPDVVLRHTDYDLDSAAAQIRATDYPHAEQFAAGNVLTCPPRPSWG